MENKGIFNMKKMIILISLLCGTASLYSMEPNSPKEEISEQDTFEQKAADELSKFEIGECLSQPKSQTTLALYGLAYNVAINKITLPGNMNSQTELKKTRDYLSKKGDHKLAMELSKKERQGYPKGGVRKTKRKLHFD